MAEYPDIRAPLRDSWRSNGPDGVRRTAMDAGPIKARVESTAVPFDESWTHKLDDTDAESLAQFYDANKALRFDLDHWVWGECEAEFQGPIVWRKSGRWTLAEVRALVYV